MTRISRKWLVVTLGLIALVVAGLVAAPQLWAGPLARVRYPRQTFGSMYLKPIFRNVVTVSDHGGTAICWSGLSVRVPWPTPIKEENTPSGLRAFFEGGKDLVVMSGPQWLDDWRAKSSESVASYGAVFGADKFISNYSIFGFLFSLTPDSTPSAKSLREAIMTRVLLQMRYDSTLSKTFRTIYTFASGDIKGFQFGDPADRGDQTVELDIFQNDHLFTILLGRSISQDEVDYILSSVRTVTRCQ